VAQNKRQPEASYAWEERLAIQSVGDAATFCTSIILGYLMYAGYNDFRKPKEFH
jgi:hypothetical protein